MARMPSKSGSSRDQEHSDLLDQPIRDEAREYAIRGFFAGREFFLLGDEKERSLLGVIAAELENSEHLEDVRFLERRTTVRELGI